MYENFERLMRRAGVRAVDVAHATGIATSTLSEWKSGKSQPKLDKLKTLAAYFDVPLSALTGEEEQQAAAQDVPSAEEWRLIRDYRALDLRGQARIRNALDFELSQKDSLISTNRRRASA